MSSTKRERMPGGSGTAGREVFVVIGKFLVSVDGPALVPAVHVFFCQ